MLPAYYITIITMDLAFTFTDANDKPVCSGRCKARIVDYFQYCPQRGHGKNRPYLHCSEARAIEELRNSGAISMISY